ncbi:aminotransferase class V-fold PLP-dependent enzyme [Pseudoflavonifractor sp. SW1122]|uniref:aminotransferase class V-fold PLP-dependent enzyme n=1 Tax=Pseudoflavonifractor sp. SW1122 TaxID=2530044 RepID=UPI00143B2ADF|nr:aminotransferase class V-fold PLP-dependent enzyme [Pseudoflavonifractor sp. SW1122]NJE74225.1 aminotransferase class V-fold PLP-dependent enzyme [Pseudoflavonifractor sp. SW1122]
MIYLDAAATSFLKPPCVAQAVVDAMHTVGSPGRGAHPLTLAASRTVWACREAVAELLGATDPARVCFTPNSTVALNTAICGLYGPGDHVITTALEHNSVLRPLYRLEGLELTILPADETGNIDYGDFTRALRPNTRGVVCTHASNVTGNTLDLKCIGNFCRAHGLTFVVDASQSAGVLEVNQQAVGASVVCFTGHKGLLGPQGTGGLSVAPDVTLRPFVVGGSGVHSYDRRHPRDLPEGLEAGTLNAHGLAGLLAGITYIKEQGRENLYRKEMKLARTFIDGVRDLPGVTLYGDVDALHRTAVVSLNLGEEDAGAVADVLAQEFGICTRAGAHCAPLIHEALGTSARGAVRFSFSHLNTPQEVAQAVDAVFELVRRLSPI